MRHDANSLRGTNAPSPSRVGVLMQVQDRPPSRFRELVAESEDTWYAELSRDREWEAAYQESCEGPESRPL